MCRCIESRIADSQCRMTRIAVSANSLVDFDRERWRLIKLEAPAEPKLVVEAKQGASFRYNGYFAVSRDLPESGEILDADLKQVVLGWSQESTSWQLGLTLSEEVSLARSSRWFEILRLTNADKSHYEQTATQLGKALATTLDVPFVTTEPALEPEPEAEPIPLVDLPLQLGMWRLQLSPDGDKNGELQLLREERWMRGRIRQIGWYALWCVVYLWVSVATLTSDLGLPNAGTLIPDPAWLPYLGIVVAVLLVLGIVRQLWIVQREPDTIAINPVENSISGWRGARQRWKVNAGGIQAVYASEVAKKRGRRPTVTHGEINLHLLNGRFLPVITDPEKIVDALLPGADAATEKKRPEGVQALEPSAVSTALQAAAVHIAVSLGDVPVWYDRRLR